MVANGTRLRGPFGFAIVDMDDRKEEKVSKIPSALTGSSLLPTFCSFRRWVIRSEDEKVVDMDDRKEEKVSKIPSALTGSLLRKESFIFNFQYLYLWCERVFGIGALSAPCLYLHARGVFPICYFSPS